MFNFFSMAGNYESRKIGRDDFGWGFVSTASVDDGTDPYETAVKHSAYGEDMVIVESYPTKDEAVEGHKKWVATMTSDTLPSKLTDCTNSWVSQLYTVACGHSKEAPLQDD